MADALHRNCPPVPAQVECYSGYKAEERPMRFAAEAVTDGWVTVKRVVRQWYEPEAECFLVEDAAGSIFHLRRDAKSGAWTLETQPSSRLR